MKTSRSNYRKIYAAHYGPIPKDSNGRSFEVHHIDGNHTNNIITNLKLVTIDEHYKLHYDQGDYVACFLMAKRMSLDPAELSELARKNTKIINERRVKDKTHNFLDRESASKWNLDRVLNNTHHLLGGAVQRKSIQDGTHASQTKICCLKCKSIINIGVFARLHKDCKAAKILPAE